MKNKVVVKISLGTFLVSGIFKIESLYLIRCY